MENLEICVFGRNEGLLKGRLIYSPVHNAFAICYVFFANLICHKDMLYNTLYILVVERLKI